MKRSAFTMIELIFVIVILGILAAVAIPRLAATRQDAKVSQLAYSIGLGMGEVAAYATSQGEVNNSMAIMSNSFALMEQKGDANLSTKKVEIKCGTTLNCIVIDINSTATDEILTMTLSNSIDTQCLALQKIIHAENYPIKLRGRNVVN